jgi:hypothetical protein
MPQRVKAVRTMLGSNRHRQRKTQSTPIFAHICNAVTHRLCRIGDTHRVSINGHRSSICWCNAEKRQPDIGAARADQSGEP